MTVRHSYRLGLLLALSVSASCHLPFFSTKKTPLSVARPASQAEVDVDVVQLQGGPRVQILRGVPALELRLPLPPLTDAEAPALELLAQVLASRSYEGAANLKVRTHWRRKAGLLTIRWPTRSIGADDVSNLVRFVSRLAGSGPTLPEMVRARAGLEAERGRELQSRRGRARRVAFYQRHGSDASFEALFAQRVRQVTLARLHDVARRFFRPSQFFLTIHHAGEALSQGVARRLLTSRGRQKTVQIQAVGGLSIATLPSGVRVRVEVDAGAPWVAFRLAWRAGSAMESHNESGISKLIAASLSREARRRHEDELRTIGGALDAVAGLDFFGLRAAGPAHSWERLLELSADMALRGPTDDVSVKAARRQLVHSALQAEADPLSRVSQLFTRQVFGAHPYALPARGRSAALSQMGLAQILRYHRQRHLPGSLVLSVVGNVDAAQVVAKAVRLLGRPRGQSVPQRSAPLSSLLPLPAWQSSTRVESSASARMVHFALGYPAPGCGRSDYVLFGLLVRVLRHRIRRDPALAPFSVDLRLGGGLLGGALILRVGAPADEAQAVLEALSKQVRGLKELISSKALAKAKGETFWQRRRTLEEQAGRAAVYAMDALAQVPAKRATLDEETLGKADSARLRAVAHRYLKSEARVLVALQPARLSPGAGLRLGGAPERLAPTSQDSVK
ncbi:MAG: insulinase family protein [Deltaproteobacteria bacterium]|nr:insulinase family protein [Deltaproteobacteria bacterium]